MKHRNLGKLACDLLARCLKAEMQLLCLKAGVWLMAYSPMGNGVLSRK